MRTLFLDALDGKNTGDVPPVWLMRQAGRYMKSYQAVRSKFSFEEICFHQELIEEVTKQPVDAFDVDAAIVFSDILFILRMFEVSVFFNDASAPIIQRGVSLENIRVVDDGRARVQELFAPLYSAIRSLQKELTVPLIGFSGAPWTLLGYLVAQKTDRSSSLVKRLIEENPSLAQRLLLEIEEIVSFHLMEQWASGCQALQLFDSWANRESESFADVWIIPSVQRVLARLQSVCPLNRVLYYSGLSPSGLEGLRNNLLTLSVTSDTPLFSWRAQYPLHGLQGNLDPSALLLPSSLIEKRVQKMKAGMGRDSHYVANLGHGVPKEVTEKSVAAFVRFVRNDTQ